MFSFVHCHYINWSGIWRLCEERERLKLKIQFMVLCFKVLLILCPRQRIGLNMHPIPDPVFDYSTTWDLETLKVSRSQGLKLSSNQIPCPQLAHILCPMHPPRSQLPAVFGYSATPPPLSLSPALIPLRLFGSESISSTDRILLLLSLLLLAP